MMNKNIINQFGANGISNVTTINVPVDTLDREIVLFGPNSNTLLGSGIISSIDKDVAPVNSFTLIANTSNPVGPNTIWLNGTTQKLYLEVGGITLDDVGSTPNDAAATLTGGVLALQPADATSPGVVTTLDQSFAGTKTFREIQLPIQSDTTYTLPMISTSALGAPVESFLTSQKPTAASAYRMGMFRSSTANADTPFATYPFGTCYGIAGCSGQVCSATATQIALTSLNVPNNQGVTLSGNRFQLTQPAIYNFTVKLEFTAGPTEYNIQLRSGPPGGALTHGANCTGITNSAALGPEIRCSGSFVLVFGGPIDVDFTIQAQSFPPGSFPSIGVTSTIVFTHITYFDFPHFGDFTTL